MKIGFIGYGKMGKDIFQAFFDKLKDTEYVIYDICGNEEENTEAVLKDLNKALKRRKLSLGEYENKKHIFRFTNDLNDFADCNMVLEAIYEDMSAKKELFAKLERIVSPMCMLLTNTSSLDIAEIFSDMKIKERCLGMHFFYPVKLTGYVELNILQESSPLYFTGLHPLIYALDKTPVTFSGEYHIYLNQILACMVSHAIKLTEEYNVSPAELDKALSDVFTVAGPFEVLSTVGLGLMAGSPENFRIERNKELLAYGCEKMNGWLADGCPKETGAFLGFAGEKLPDTGNDAGSAKLSMLSLILNETLNAMIDTGQKTGLANAVKDTLGLEKSQAEYYSELGADAIFAELDRLHDKYGYGSYVHREKEIWDRYYS
ncbi:MAG: 3-hydroxyacyl-CoA dehydrogenase family protein [Ruminococcus sp.]|nr:3-hydroxyacyl-CoA dehydrogenase family protein [Ruminococcus sp.]